MEGAAAKKEIIDKLQKQILSMQGLRSPKDHRSAVALGPVEYAFPQHTFPTGVIHEFLSSAAESAAATTGFMAGLLGQLMLQPGPCLWIGTKRTLFPPALSFFGVDPGRIIFIDLVKEKDLLWTVEEALKCDALSAVVAEVEEISFAQSRRLQLAVQHSHVTGLMHCYHPGKVHGTISVARWKITPLASELQGKMPGVGHPRWNVELSKIRNGQPGTWQMQWSAGTFQQVRYGIGPSLLSLEKTA